VSIPIPTRVFISYSHDSADHRRRILELANQLRQDGVDAQIDQYVEFPEEGWPRWMRSKIEEADAVLVVCSPIYKSRFDGVDAPVKGLGARWEGLILTQSLYEDFSQNRARFIPILIGDTPDAAIPVVLKPFTYFRIPEQYEQLYRLVTKQPAVVEPPVGSVKTLSAEAPAPVSPTPPLPVGGNSYSGPSGAPPFGNRHLDGLLVTALPTASELLTPEGDQAITLPIALRRDVRSVDSPPHVPIFVGRQSHLHSLANLNIRVAGVTGLGGEGKSTIAAQFFALARRGGTPTSFSRFGWCDCKELESTFHERLLLLIEELSHGSEPTARYPDENIQQTLDRFVRQLHQNECLVVFDNVDAFVDKDSASFVDSVGALFERLTTQLSRSLVIFTCRPSIRDYRPSFLEIPVSGLAFSETRELAGRLGLSIADDVLHEIFDRTNGHALWLNLILGQLRSGRISSGEVQSLLASPVSIVHDLNTRLLRSIWDNLTAREKEILIVISTFTRPQEITRIARASELSYQRCVRLLRTLASLRLVQEVDVSGITHYDLHPIVRAKARTECGRIKRQKLTARVIAALIPMGFPGLGILIRTRGVSRESIDAYIESTEIAIENEAVRRAVDQLSELAKYLWQIGEEPKFIDLTKRLLDTLQPSDLRIGVDESLTSVFDVFIHVLLEQDDATTADKYLRRFEEGLETIAQLMKWATLRSYYLWYTDDHATAIEFMAARMIQIKEKGEEIPHDLRYNYALALRDFGRVEEALEIFADGRVLDAILVSQPDSDEDVSTSDIGNIGRCLYLKGDYGHALQFVSKSADILRRGEERMDKVNYGYAGLWLADVYVKLGRYKDAYAALREVIGTWSKHAPARLRKVGTHTVDYPEEFWEYGVANGEDNPLGSL
jgi:tetratricopeptide (TPR) repeat protein